MSRSLFLLFATIVSLVLSTPAAAQIRMLEPILEPMVYETNPADPLTLLLSRCVYPAEDGYIDAIVWLGDIPGDQPAPGTLDIALVAADGSTAVTDTVTPIPGGRLFFSIPFDTIAPHQSGSLHVAWRDADGQLLGRSEQPFSIAEPKSSPRSGRIPLTIPNDSKVAGMILPVTIGVPFPIGAVEDDSRIRLVTADGTELNMQSRVTARWSRFGSIKWLLCSFSVHLDGSPLTVFLEFGPDTQRHDQNAIAVQNRGSRAPLIEVGNLRFGNGIEVNSGNGFQTIVSEEGLSGGFVEHENGAIYSQPADAEWIVEEQGPEKVTLLRKGWYRNTETGESFCKFVTRFVLHRDSNLLTLMNTWIFTGDAYQDRIRNMGWQLNLSAPAAGSFLTDSNTEAADWISGDYLLQYDFDEFFIAGKDDTIIHHGERAPGIVRSQLDGVSIVAGVNDFWQNYPNEIEFASSSLFIHQWPRHGRPALHPARIDDGLRLWFAHEGEVLDFALPIEWTEDPDFYYAAGSREPYQLRHQRQTVNAQGIAKTDEIRLWFGPAAYSADAARMLKGLDDATLRAYVDPQWLAESRTFYEIHHRDVERFPDEEHYFELAALAPMKWIERIRFYGKWIWGDMTWVPDLDDRGFGLYRGFRKAHQGWPYSWIPYARSGDPRLFKHADAATRHQIDVVFCHYSDARVPGRLDDGEGRSRGFYPRYRVPWATHQVNPSTRSYIDKADYLLHSYYLTGFPRTWDVYTDWANLTKTEGWNFRTVGFDDHANFRYPMVSGAEHGSVNLLKAYIESYEALFDPWFLAAAHQIARVHKEAFAKDNWMGISNQPGPREFLRFTGCSEYRPFYLAYARKYTDPAADFYHYLDTYPMMEPAAFGYLQTADPYFLRRTRAMVDEAVDWAYTYDGEPDYHRGRRVTGGWTHHMGYLVQQFPFALHVLANADPDVDPLPNHSYQLPGDASAVQIVHDEQRAFHYAYNLMLLKQPDEPLPINLYFQSTGLQGFRYQLVGPDGETTFTGVVDASTLKQIRQAAGAHLLPQSGSWAVSSIPYSFEVPAEAPPGIWSLHIEGESLQRPGHQVRDVDAVRMPVSTPEVGEVWVLGDDRETGPTIHNQGALYWFYVPADTTEFQLEFIQALRGRIPTITVRGPDGKRVWSFQAPADTPAQPSDEPLIAVITVPPGKAGQLWRVVIGGRSGGVRFDPNLPPYIALDPRKWFNSDTLEAAPDSANHKSPLQ